MLNRDSVLGIIRHVLTFGGGIATARGVADSEDTSVIIGALIALIGGIWSIIEKRQRAKASATVTIPPAGGGVALLIALGGLGLVAGCGTIAPGHDAIVVRAEQSTVIAAEMVDAFLSWEYLHGAAVGADVHKAADSLRERAPLALQSARVLTKAYKQNRTPENKANLLTALAVIEAMQSEAALHLRSQVTSSSH